MRLTVFEIFAVKWPKFRPKISDLGIPGVRPQRGEDLSGTDMYYHAKFHTIGATVAEISVTGQRKKTATNIPFHYQDTNIIRYGGLVGI